ncbi:MAG: [citrate (pro-3S)-lyase] ligase [bacterium]|nr:[citrate (pro-3S)-lyase] ligase [bacterium]
MGIETADFRTEVIDITSKYDINHVENFMIPLGFDYDPTGVDYTMMLYNLNNQILGTGSYLNGVLKYVAVAPKFRETAAFPQIVTHLNNKVLADGYKTVFVYTNPATSVKFQGLGFVEIALAEPFYAFLEFGYVTIKHYKKYLRSLRRETKNGDIASIVVNCNPFTNGHLYLIEKAAAENEVVYLFVVEEERSVFSFKTRLELIKKGTAHLDNVVIVKGGRYIVSGATFPSYFLKNESVDLITRNQMELDVTVFAKHIATELGIKKRYVGTEVYCETTAAYNMAMKHVLTSFDIKQEEITRKTVGSADNFISASKVRAAIKSGEIDSIRDFIPPTTYDYLKSTDAKETIEKIQGIDSRH